MFTEGASVGFEVGNSDGRSVGDEDDFFGLEDGFGVGFFVNFVGEDVGGALGWSIGALLGRPDG
jgi:hypothetical protein